jgi:hypothetical protein
MPIDRSGVSQYSRYCWYGFKCVPSIDISVPGGPEEGVRISTGGGPIVPEIAGVLVDVAVAAGADVSVGIGVDVSVGSEVLVAVSVGVLAGVSVGSAVGVWVAVGACVGVGSSVGDGSRVTVGSGASVAVAVGGRDVAVSTKAGVAVSSGKPRVRAHPPMQ